MSSVCERHFIPTVMTSFFFFVVVILSVKQTWYLGSKEVKVIKHSTNKTEIE